MSLKQSIKEKALDLGFNLVGVTTPDAPDHINIFKNWLKRDHHGEMHYLATERSIKRRADPRAILPECKSILVAAARYPSHKEDLYPEGDHGTITVGKVAAYAWGADYHDVFAEKLETLGDFIDIQLGRSIPKRWYTDTGPILERDLAQRAGLGWIGKNTCLINPRIGSFFFLAEILLGVELEADKPFGQDRCGTCTRCQDACPTSCILPDRTLDASRCISYLTIELKNAIPVDLRASLGQWIFGCDICQQVCPWNRRAAERVHPDEVVFKENLKIASPNLIREISLTPNDFRMKFGGARSPVTRAKRGGYLRNVAVALGNVKDSNSEEIEDALIQALMNEKDPLVRGHICWALGRFNSEKTRRVLEKVSREESDIKVKREIREALTP